MTEKEMRCVKALRICHSNEDCRDCEFMEADRDEKSCVNILFEESADLIESLSERLEAAQPKWISVEERLPEELEDVLILVKETEIYGLYNEFSKSYLCQYVGQYDGEWYTVYCHGHRYIEDTAKQTNADKLEVTHWMPLPAPPKEEA